MGYLGATLTQVFTRTGGADVSLRDVTIAQVGIGSIECGWRHASEALGGFWGFWKGQLVESSPGSGEDGWPVAFVAGATRVGGRGRWKSQDRKNVYLSPYVEEPLNSKVIKSFVPELRSRKCFSCFEIPMFYVYMLWTFHVRFTHSRIWQWNITDEYSADSALLVNTQAEFPLHRLKWAVRSISLYGNSDNNEFLRFNQDDGICSWNRKPMKLIEQFIHIPW